MTALHRLTATDAARRIASGELSPQSLVDACLDRIHAHEPVVHAWAYLDTDGAREQALTLGDEAARGHIRGPLHGIPIGVKDIFHVAGMPTRAGSRWFSEAPAADATSVARLRAAGAIIIGKTHTTEFALMDPSPARNPWNPAHTPGGSSSGSAAAVGAGMVPAALGSQTAGSVLRPAAFCGVVGYKPTWGRISRAGVLPLAWSLDHVGTLTRSVEDAALLLSVMAGPDPRDPTAAAVALSASRLQAGPARLLVCEVYPERLEESARGALHSAAAQLRDAGAAVEPLQLPPEVNAILDAQQVIMSSEIAAVHADGLRLHAEQYGPRLRATAESGALIPASLYLRAQQMRAAIRAAVLPSFAGGALFLVPSAAGPAPEGLESTGDPSFNTPWSLLGFPAISLLAGRDSNGLPLAVQLVAAPWQEARLLQAAAWCEQVLGRADVAESPA